MICEGGFESVDINPSKIVRVAVWHDAPYVLFAHNHPGGIAKPSNADLVTTHAIERVLRVIGVEVLDHIIVADGEYYSMSNEGNLLKQQRYYIENSDNDDLWG
ncbi:MAG: hypothetical protein J1F01_03150 [Oscillospiraceae bacterium]|nr:hypothetical protein [Oscillospiraceae bacterium]